MDYFPVLLSYCGKRRNHRAASVKEDNWSWAYTVPNAYQKDHTGLPKFWKRNRAHVSSRVLYCFRGAVPGYARYGSGYRALSLEDDVVAWQSLPDYHDWKRKDVMVLSPQLVCCGETNNPKTLKLKTWPPKHRCHYPVLKPPGACGLWMHLPARLKWRSQKRKADRYARTFKTSAKRVK